MGGSVPGRMSKLQRVAAIVCGSAALVLAGYVLGSRQSTLLGEKAVISKVGSVLSEADFKTLYSTVTSGVNDAQLAAYNYQIIATGATVNNANVQLLRNWYSGGTNANKLFANKLIAASMTSATKATTVSTGAETATVRCPVSNYRQFGKLYSDETAGKTWDEITRIDSWVRLSTTAIGAPLSVRKLRECYQHSLSAANRKDFDTNAVAHMHAGNPR